jgi:hypothetical protein
VILVEIGILPFGTRHGMVVIVAQNLGVDPDRPQQLGVEVGIVRDIPYVQDSQGTPVFLLEVAQPGSDA